jgi:glycosyltransferase EpsE
MTVIWLEEGTKQMSTISVIMAVYNCKDTLPEAIESILSQTYTDWELIICDDASTDGTYEIAKSYAKKYPDKIKLIRNEVNSKLAYSLNRCLEIATGKYIARMDGDDISMPERLQEQIEFLETHPDISVVGCWMTPFNESGKGKPRIYKENPNKKDLLKGPPFAHATIIMRKSAYEAVNGYRVSSMTARTQDYDMWFRFFASGFKGYNLQKSLYYVREDTNAYSRRKLWVYLNEIKIRWHGFKIVRFHVWEYAYVLRPIGSYFINLTKYKKCNKASKPEY